MKEQRPLIMVTNDDGIDAPGIRHLIEIVREFGDLIVVAPESGMSGMSHAITVREPLRVTKVREVPGITEYSCKGTPVDAVKLGEKMLLKRKPDLLVSGINHGSNASVNIVYSGTMAAAIEACMDGVKAIGFSLTDYAHDADFSVCTPWVQSVVAWVLKEGLPQGVCLNVNIPAIPADAIRGMKVCRQADGTWQETFEARLDPFHREYFWLTGAFHERRDGSDTDLVALREGYVSVVPVKYDLTAHKAMRSLKDLNIKVEVQQDPTADHNGIKDEAAQA